MYILKSKSVNKNNILKAIIIIYIAVSLLYIIYTALNYWRISLAQEYLEQGRVLTIEQLINQTEQSKCEAFYVYTESKNVRLVNADCFIKTENDEINDLK